MLWGTSGVHAGMTEAGDSIGGRAYAIRQASGEEWREIATRLGYRPDNDDRGKRLMDASRSWAKGNRKPWPPVADTSGDDGEAEADAGEEAGEAVTRAELLEARIEIVELREAVRSQGKQIGEIVTALNAVIKQTHELTAMLGPQLIAYREDCWHAKARARNAAESKPPPSAWAAWAR